MKILRKSRVSLPRLVLAKPKYSLILFISLLFYHISIQNFRSASVISIYQWRYQISIPFVATISYIAIFSSIITNLWGIFHRSSVEFCKWTPLLRFSLSIFFSTFNYIARSFVYIVFEVLFADYLLQVTSSSWSSFG